MADKRRHTQYELYAYSSGLAKENPFTYESDLATTQMNMANIYSVWHRYSESIELLK